MNKISLAITALLSIFAANASENLPRNDSQNTQTSRLQNEPRHTHESSQNTHHQHTHRANQAQNSQGQTANQPKRIPLAPIINGLRSDQRRH
jgi:ABC-type nickel/cobalt efflux system permease component RcnA